MKKWILISTLICLFLFTTRSPEAARPLSTDDAGTVEKEKFELELGYDHSKSRDNIEDKAAGLSLKHGLTDRLDFYVALPYEIEPDEGPDGAELGVKFSLLEEKKNLPAISSTFSYKAGNSAYTLNMIASKGVEPLICHLNVGFEATGQVTQNGVTTYSVAVEHSVVGEKLNLVGEVVGNEDNLFIGLIGTSFQVWKGLTFDMGASFGLNSDSPKGGLTIGLTTEL